MNLYRDPWVKETADCMNDCASVGPGGNLYEANESEGDVGLEKD